MASPPRIASVNSSCTFTQSTPDTPHFANSSTPRCADTHAPTSSRAARASIDIAATLGTPIYVPADGVVVHGAKRGRTIGFPTANLATEKELLPADGVYAVKVRVGDALYDGACNIGRNPTFGNHETSIEVFLLDYSGDLYGQEIRIFFVERIRGERKFTGVEALKEAIAADVARCREILRNARIIEYQEYLGDPDV